YYHNVRGAKASRRFPMTSKATVFLLDDRVAASAAAALLQTAGHAAESYSSAVAFLAACNPRRAGCLVVDPKTTGIAQDKFLERVQTLHPRLSIVVTTFGQNEREEREWLQRGVVGVLTKPFDADEFLELVERGLARSEAQFGR